MEYRRASDAMPLLFSYGTLQHEDVQVKTFGRRLNGSRDELVGFEQQTVIIDDPKIVAMYGRAHHANVVSNERKDSRVTGTVFEVTEAELAAADEYERPTAYVRIIAPLASGQQTWVYVDSRSLKDRGAG
jgi:gamma-glutamylcyclotransferase (GGCT)/AIG2-like uncharacterized protein YtfP